MRPGVDTSARKWLLASRDIRLGTLPIRRVISRMLRLIHCGTVGVFERALAKKNQLLRFIRPLAIAILSLFPIVTANSGTNVLWQTLVLLLLPPY